MIIHIPLYKRNKHLETGATCASHCDGWLYLRIECNMWKPWRCGGRDAQGRGRVYFKGLTFECAIGLSVGRTDYSVTHDEY